MSNDPELQEAVEYAATWTVDGKTVYQHATDEQDAHRRVARMMGHHRRANVKGSDYRVVRRVVMQGPWQ